MKKTVPLYAFGKRSAKAERFSRTASAGEGVLEVPKASSGTIGTVQKSMHLAPLQTWLGALAFSALASPIVIASEKQAPWVIIYVIVLGAAFLLITDLRSSMRRLTSYAKKLKTDDKDTEPASLSESIAGADWLLWAAHGSSEVTAKSRRIAAKAQRMQRKNPAMLIGPSSAPGEFILRRQDGTLFRVNIKSLTATEQSFSQSESAKDLLTTVAECFARFEERLEASAAETKAKEHGK
jgi:hypothetical protein